MRMSHDKLAAVLVTVVCAACVRPGVRSSAPRLDLNVLTREQLVENHFTTAYEAVEALRGNWLLTRGFRAPSNVQVYFDDVRLGGIESLRSVSINPISYIEYFDGLAATERWGLDHGAGVIYVSTRATVDRSAKG